MSVAEVRLWGRNIGAVAWDDKHNIARFEYEPTFTESGIEIAPLTMPLAARKIYAFPELPPQTFHGLPGLLADSLPDKFGNALIDAWLAKEGRSPGAFNPVERLCYIGRRGTGALEFLPSRSPFRQSSHKIDIASLVELTGEILTQRKSIQGSFKSTSRKPALQDILRVGTSAGGARAKAVIAWNPETEEVRSGQLEASSGFTHWILKFDGVRGNKDKELEDPKGYGLIEYAYYLMARSAGIEMTECRILEENGRHHFMTRRFDRTRTGEKIHMQSLGALAHYDFNQAGAYAYEQAVGVIRRLHLPMEAVEEQFRRMAFNIVARNQDDHVKNIAFLMNKKGQWRLSPAFDVIYSYNPSGPWTSRHQMSMNGKTDDFTKEDFVVFGNTVSMKKGRALTILSEVEEAVSQWPKFAAQAGVDKAQIKQISAAHRHI